MQVKYFDPFHWYLYFAHKKFFLSNPTQSEINFAERNIVKHRLIQWINIIAIILIYLGFRKITEDQIGIVVTSLIAPVMLLGGAWFSITFGAVPAKFFEFTLGITSWMYAAFKVALSMMFFSIAYITTWPIWILLLFIYIAIDYASIPYDTADALKSGLDEASFKHSKAAVLYYNSQGIDIE